MKQKMNRWFSGFLAVVMLLSLLPSSVYAYDQVDNKTGTTGAISGDAPTAGWSIPYEANWGIKFTLYFAEGITKEDQIPNATFTQLGRDYYVRMTGSKSYSYTSKHNIYQKAHGDTDFNRVNINNLISKSEIPVLGSFPSGFLETNKVKQEDLTEFFAGIRTKKSLMDLTDEEKNQLDFTNTVAIANRLVEGYGITNINWSDGKYTDSTGNHRGVFKLYYEPFYYFQIASNGYALTLHDAIAFQKSYPKLKADLGNGKSTDFKGYFYNYILNLANSVMLAFGEPTLNMNSANPLPVGSDNANYSTVNNKWGSLFDGYGIGVITGGLTPGKGQKIIASYVEIVDVDSQGNSVFKTIAETEDITYDTTITEDDVAQLQAARKVNYNGELMDAMLNDIVTSEKDITTDGVEKIVWENVITPQAPSDKINNNVEDV